MKILVYPDRVQVVPNKTEEEEGVIAKFSISDLVKENIRPLGARLVVIPDEAEDVTKGGIIIPESVKEKPQRGIVVAAGPGTDAEPAMVEAGDIVLYSKYSGTEIEFNGKTVLLMRQSDILAAVGKSEVKI